MRCPEERYFAATGNGAIWGIGSTPRSARRDGRKIVGAPRRFVIREITFAQFAIVTTVPMQVSMEAVGLR